MFGSRSRSDVTTTTTTTSSDDSQNYNLQDSSGFFTGGGDLVYQTSDMGAIGEAFGFAGDLANKALDAITLNSRNAFEAQDNALRVAERSSGAAMNVAERSARSQSDTVLDAQAKVMTIAAIMGGVAFVVFVWGRSK